MADTLNFELVSPEEKLVSEPVTMVVVPGVEGEIGVLPQHSSLVAALKPGVVRLNKDGSSNEDQIFIAGGFADITGDQCTVLAEEAMPVSQLDKAALTQELQDLREDLGIAVEAIDKKRIEMKIALVEAKLLAAA